MGGPETMIARDRGPLLDGLKDMEISKLRTELGEKDLELKQVRAELKAVDEELRKHCPDHPRFQSKPESEADTLYKEITPAECVQPTGEMPYLVGHTGPTRRIGADYSEARWVVLVDGQEHVVDDIEANGITLCGKLYRNCNPCKGWVTCPECRRLSGLAKEQKPIETKDIQHIIASDAQHLIKLLNTDKDSRFRSVEAHMAYDENGGYIACEATHFYNDGDSHIEYEVILRPVRRKG
jgi:hypothetical protein